MQIDGFGESIEPQAILARVDDRQQTLLKFLDLHLVDATFKDGFLHTLANALAGARDSAQASTAFASFGGNVIADDDQHESPGDERQVGFGLATQGACEQARLDLREQA